MKTPTARKLPSGSWFVRVQKDGKAVSVTRPTRKEAEAEALRIKLGDKQVHKSETLRDAVNEYIDKRRNTRSPATIRGYVTIANNRFQQLMNMDVNEITRDDCMKAMNEEAARMSAKTLKSSWLFISSCIYEKTSKRFHLDLPQVIPPDRPWLDPEQIKVFLSAVHGKKCEVPALMALSSLRRSELMAVQWKDIDLEKGTLKVTGAVVPDEHNKMVYKEETKNLSSRRTVPIIPQLREALGTMPHDSDFVVTCHPATVWSQINQVCEEAGLPKVGVHGLRHSFASLAYHLGIPEKEAMKIGGWADDRTMHKIYTHLADKDMAEAQNKFTQFYENCNETVIKRA